MWSFRAVTILRFHDASAVYQNNLKFTSKLYPEPNRTQIEILIQIQTQYYAKTEITTKSKFKFKF